MASEPDYQEQSAGSRGDRRPRLLAIAMKLAERKLQNK
jgi:hypothetical protein